MEKVRAIKWDDNALVLANVEDIERVYDLVGKEENFILIWDEGGVETSRLIMANEWAAKVKTGDIQLTSRRVED